MENSPRNRVVNKPSAGQHPGLVYPLGCRQPARMRALPWTCKTPYLQGPHRVGPRQERRLWGKVAAGQQICWLLAQRRKVSQGIAAQAYLIYANLALLEQNRAKRGQGGRTTALADPFAFFLSTCASEQELGRGSILGKRRHLTS